MKILKINKPKVFLSHSKKDAKFIEKLSSDLRKCQIDPWLDTDEIRDGRPWLQVIFEEGIPTCDAVIVYLTNNSLNSKLVSKEIDAALIEQLSESGISFLPYVSTGRIRAKLRSDIKSLQCREWNNKNYFYLLPSVVSEIWRSYTEKVTNLALLQEKNRRLEAEITLKTLKEKEQGSIFSSSDSIDFQYVFKKLNGKVELKKDIFERKSEKEARKKIGVDLFEFNLLNCLGFYHIQSYYYFATFYLGSEINRKLDKDGFPKQKKNSIRNYTLDTFPPSIYSDLLKFGLIKSIQTESHGKLEHQYIFTGKMHKFQYLLEFKKLISPTISYKYKGFSKKIKKA